MKGVEIVNVGVGVGDTKGLCETAFECVEYVDVWDDGIKGAEAMVIVDVGGWVGDVALLIISSVLVEEGDASRNAVDMALFVMVTEASADVKLGDVVCVCVLAVVLAEVDFVASADAVLLNAGFVVDAKYAEIVDVADIVVSFEVVFDKGCGVVEYTERMDTGVVVDVEDEGFVDVGIVV